MSNWVNPRKTVCQTGVMGSRSLRSQLLRVLKTKRTGWMLKMLSKRILERLMTLA